MTEFDAVLDPRLFPGDHVAVELIDGTVEQHIIRKLVLPFPSGRMTVTTRLSLLGVCLAGLGFSRRGNRGGLSSTRERSCEAAPGATLPVPATGR